MTTTTTSNASAEQLHAADLAARRAYDASVVAVREAVRDQEANPDAVGVAIAVVEAYVARQLAQDNADKARQAARRGW